MERTFVICCLTGILATGLPGSAAEYPDRPIRFIVPYSAGGNTDIVARVLAEKLSVRLGQQLVVDNRGGAGGTIGAQLAAQAAPDGYTLLMGTAGTHAVNISLFKKLPYDPLQDFVPVSLVAKAALLLVVNPGFPPRSVNELIQFLRAARSPVNYASSGLGTASHLAMELLRAKTGRQLTHVPYRGNAQAVTDLLGGQVPLMFMTSISALPLVSSGKLVALGVSNAYRLAVAPNIPTIAETLPGFDASPWYGVFAPAKTPARIVVRLNSEIVSILKLPVVKKLIEEQGGEVVGNSKEEFAAFQKAEIDKWREVIRASGAKVN